MRRRSRLRGLLLVIPLLASVHVRAQEDAVRITGRPGDFAVIELTATVLLGNGGADSEVAATTGRWEGLLIQRITAGYKAPDFYMHLRPRPSWICGSRPCNENPGLDFVSGSTHELPDGNYVYRLRRGKYLIALLGDPGARVQGQVRLPGLRAGTALNLQPNDTTSLQTFEFGSIVEGSERELVSRGFKGRDSDSTHLNGLVIAYDMAIPGALMTSTCFSATDQGNGTLARAACADGGGPAPPTPVLFGNRLWGRSYAQAQAPADAFFGYGYDLELQTTGDAHISALWWSMNLPDPTSLTRPTHSAKKAVDPGGVLPPTGISFGTGSGLTLLCAAVGLGAIVGFLGQVRRPRDKPRRPTAAPCGGGD